MKEVKQTKFVYFDNVKKMISKILTISINIFLDLKVEINIVNSNRIF